MNMRKSLTMNLLKKEKIGNKRKITLFGFLKISYKKHNDEKHQKIIITDEGKNNSINGLNPLQYQVFGDGKIIIKGNNTHLNVGEKPNFNNFHLEIWGDNVLIDIGNNPSFNNVYAVFSGNKDLTSKISIGDNFWNTDDLQIFGGGNKNMDIEIGNDCMFARRIAIYAHDGHNIYNGTTNEIINIPKNSLKIGNHVWVGHGVHISKGSIIEDNSIIGMGSVVAGKFEKGVIIAGNPAKKIRENINWSK